MPAQDTATVVRKLYDMWNRREFDAIAELASADVEWLVVPTGETAHGRDQYRQAGEAWSRAFPDGRTEVVNLIASETQAAVEFIGRGTHTGPLATPTGDIPPTGRRVEHRFCDVYDVKDGKIVRGRQYFDLAGLMAQLGMKG